MSLYLGAATGYADIGGLMSPNSKESQPWPPKEDRPRLSLYSRNYKLYFGKHEEVYVDMDKYYYDSDRPYVHMNLLAETTNLTTDRMLGEGFEVIVPDESKEWAKHLLDYNKFDSLLRKECVGSSYKGDGVVQVGYDIERSEIIFTPVSASNFYVQTNPNDSNMITEQMIAWVINVDDEKGHRELLFQEIHMPGQISYYLYKLSGTYQSGTYSYNPKTDRLPLNTLPQFAGLEDIVFTGVDNFLCSHIALGGSDDSNIWGKSDYLNTDSLQGELNNRMNQLAEILDKHANPWMFGFPISDEDNNISVQDKYIDVVPGENVPAPEYITWDASLDAVYKEIDQLKRDIVFDAGLSPSSFGFEQEDSPESGIAIKRRQMRTQSKVQLRQTEFTYFIQSILSVASELSNSNKIGPLNAPPTRILEPHEISVQWADGIPQSTLELLQEEEIALRLGLSSRKTSMKRVYGYEDAVLEEEMATVKVEMDVEDMLVKANRGEELGGRLNESDME